jgi:hypothetical protein
MKTRIVLARGAHVGRRLDPLGRSLGAITVTLPKTAIVTMDKRKRVVKGGGIWYEITSGSLAGTWVPEAPGFAYAYGANVRIAYPVVRTLAMPAPTTPVSVVQVATSGALLHSGTITAAGTSSTFSFNARGTVNGVDRLRISSGPWAGWWIATPGLTLDPT